MDRIVIRPWRGGDTDESGYFDPDPYRHDVPDVCSCTHQIGDHNHNDGGCARLQCTCRWYEDAPWR